MVRNYVAKTNRNLWEPSNLSRAIEAVQKNEMTIRQASVEYDIPKSTLYDRLKSQNFTAPSSGKKTVFNEEMEGALKNHILQMSNIFHGLTTKEVRRVAYEFAENVNKDHPFNKEKQQAGWDWFYSFLNRHPDLKLRTPEATSLNRLKGFCKEEVDDFFKNVGSVYESNKIVPSKIYNMDETALPTVPKLSRVVAQKGIKRLGKAVSAERGTTTTLIACVSATGNYISPFFIYRRQNRNDVLINGAPAGSDYAVSKSGWTNEEIFVDWLQHFKMNSGASSENKTVLILDNHTSHCSLAAWNFCRENGIIMVSLPPHCSHRMQPLDLTVFGPMKKAYYEQCDNFLKTYQRPITQFDVAGIFAVAWNRIINVEKAVNGFASAGIWPFNAQKFENEWNKEKQTAPQVEKNMPESIASSANPNQSEENFALPSTPLSENSVYSKIIEKTSVDTLLKKSSPIQQKQASKKRRGRPKGHSEVLTSTPKKQLLIQKDKNLVQKLGYSEVCEKGEKQKIVKRKLEVDGTESSSSKRKVSLPGRTTLKTKQKIPTKEDDLKEDEWFCIYCDGKYVDPPEEDWIECSTCSRWCHERCAESDILRIKKVFKCVVCLNNKRN